MVGWAEERKIALIHIQPGKPMQNGHVESFHGRLRDECLNVNWFRTLNNVRTTLASWQQEYNWERPHKLAGLSNAGRVPATSRLCKCGKPRTLPTFAQPRRRRRDPLNAKTKTRISGYEWMRAWGHVRVTAPNVKNSTLARSETF
jgi:hypothetical protein